MWEMYPSRGSNVYGQQSYSSQSSYGQSVSIFFCCCCGGGVFGVVIEIYLINKLWFISNWKRSLGVTGKVDAMWLGGYGFQPWKQSLAEMQCKAANNRPL